MDKTKFMEQIVEQLSQNDQSLKKVASLTLGKELVLDRDEVARIIVKHYPDQATKMVESVLNRNPQTLKVWQEALNQ